MASDKPERPYNPNDQGSNWAPINRPETLTERAKKLIHLNRKDKPK